MKKVFIFGLGHLSKFLIKELADDLIDDFEISGTYRSKKLDESLFPVKHQIHYDTSTDFDFTQIKKSYDYVIWSFPPIENYVEVLEKFDHFFDDRTAWVFISSTSVYKTGRVTEKSKRDNDRFRMANLNVIEDKIQTFKRPITVVRPSGLVDENRNPAHFFKSVDRPLALKGEMTNLVHTKDVARFLKVIIEKNIQNENFNLASAQHYEKSQFYSTLLKAKSVKPPVFIDSPQKGCPKLIDSSKSRALGFAYEYDDLLNYFI